MYGHKMTVTVPNLLLWTLIPNFFSEKQEQNEQKNPANLQDEVHTILAFLFDVDCGDGCRFAIIISLWQAVFMK